MSSTNKLATKYVEDDHTSDDTLPTGGIQKCVLIVEVLPYKGHCGLHLSANTNILSLYCLGLQQPHHKNWTRKKDSSY